ncbi:MAG: DNA polymerase III subunit delta', partial [Bdellovibrionales bacterium]
MDLFGEPDIVKQDTLATPDTAATAPPADLFTHPRFMPFCMGHDDTEQQLLNWHQSGRMPHGIIFAGAKGIGKATLAYRLARFLFKHGTNDPNQNALFDAPTDYAAQSLDIPADDLVFRRVASGGHPDLLTIERVYDATKNKEAETLSVAELRKVEPFLRKTASEGGWRVVIIDDADTMNRNAQNALLKILEEPPANTVLILIAHRAGALIPTIRSRTRTLHFQPLSPTVMEELLSQKGHILAPDQNRMLAARAEGSFGTALKILEEGGLETLDTLTSLLTSIPDFDWVAIHGLADTLARPGAEKDYQAFTDTLLWLYKTLTFAKARGQIAPP